MNILSNQRAISEKYYKYADNSKESQIWHPTEGRLTWYALELGALIDMNYRLVQTETGVFMRYVGDDINSESISEITFNYGVNNYLKSD